ncbi:MAG: ABC transporter ATP-binding protein [Candidatus Heimdallarchaeaceae archaeon]
MSKLIEIKELYKIYSGIVETVAIENFSANFEEGEIVAVAGPSGSGKTTLLSCIGGVLRPTSGRVFVEGQDITKYNDEELAKYRCNKVGLVYQDYNLISQFTIYENVAVPLLIAGYKRSEIKEQVTSLLKSFNIERYANTFPPYLSGGEQQRVAICVALANDPPIILADEPTGNLDRQTTETVLNFLIEKCRENNKTVIIASHDPFVLESVDRVIYLNKGLHLQSK